MQPLLPRYRRPLSFGGVLDETFRLYRSAWPRLMAVTALAVIPSAVAIFALTGQIFIALSRFSVPDVDPAALTPVMAGLGVGVALASIVSGLAVLVGQGGVTAMTGWLMRGEDRPAWTALTLALRKLLVMLGAVILATLGVLGLSLLAVPLLVLGVGGLLGGLIALIALVVWVKRPEERRTKGLKWLIILATPFGLPMYYSVRWSLAIPAIFQEHAGPVRALGRSGELVEGRWFPVCGVWVVLGIVVSLLQSVPVAIIGLVGTIVGANAADPQSAGIGVSIAQNAASIVGSILFGALTFIASTIMFVDARNRLEGVDLAERLEQLQVGLPATF